MRIKILLSVAILLATLLGAFGIWRYTHTREEKANLLPTKTAEDFFKAQGERQAKRQMLASRIYFQEQVVREFPDNIDAKLTLAKLYITAEYPEKAKLTLEQIIAKEPTHPEANRLYQELNQ